MRTYSIRDVIDGLSAMPDAQVTLEGIHNFLAERPIDADTLGRFHFWDKDHYTRNLVYKDERFEVLVVCWEVGQISRIHDHAGQQCWMTVPEGRLVGRNFSVEMLDNFAGRCRLRESDHFELSHRLPATVEPEEPIHQVGNPAEFDERAVSVHIYSKPYDRCRTFCRETDTFREVVLGYTSIDGERVAGSLT